MPAVAGRVAEGGAARHWDLPLVHFGSVPRPCALHSVCRDVRRVRWRPPALQQRRGECIPRSTVPGASFWILLSSGAVVRCRHRQCVHPPRSGLNSRLQKPKKKSLRCACAPNPKPLGQSPQTANVYASKCNCTHRGLARTPPDVTRKAKPPLRLNDVTTDGVSGEATAAANTSARSPTTLQLE
jgi:hypothetical protein